MATPQRSRFVRAAGWCLAIAVFWGVGRQLITQLRELGQHPLAAQPNWTLIAASGALFLLAHASLVQTWRSVLSCWGAHLPFWSSARIWSVSNLGKYLPGKVWQIGAMGAMARDSGVSSLAATGSAILGALVNLLVGLVVGAVAGRRMLARLSGNGETVALAAIVTLCTALVTAPWLVPRIVPYAARLIGRPLVATLPARAVAHSIVGNLIAWLIYGAAFECFMKGAVVRSSGGYLDYLAAYTISYVFGYLALFAPAGLGAREYAMYAVLSSAGMATAPHAALVTVASRIWLTLLEVTPGFLFWALHAVRRPPTIGSSDAPAG